MVGGETAKRRLERDSLRQRRLGIIDVSGIAPEPRKPEGIRGDPVKLLLPAYDNTESILRFRAVFLDDKAHCR
jgi:hypothetical protein